MGSIEGPLTTLSFLRTVTLETTDEAESADLAERFPVLRNGGRLRHRTCTEAQKLAQDVQRNVAGYVEQHGAVSPLWYSDDYRGDRDQWYVDVLWTCMTLHMWTSLLMTSSFRLKRGDEDLKELEELAEDARNDAEQSDEERSNSDEGSELMSSADDDRSRSDLSTSSSEDEDHSHSDFSTSSFADDDGSQSNFATSSSIDDDGSDSDISFFDFGDRGRE